MAGNLLLAFDGHRGPARGAFPVDKGQGPTAVCEPMGQGPRHSPGRHQGHPSHFLPVPHRREGELGLREGKRPAPTTQLGEGGGAQRRTQFGVNDCSCGLLLCKMGMCFFATHHVVVEHLLKSQG